MYNYDIIYEFVNLFYNVFKVLRIILINWNDKIIKLCGIIFFEFVILIMFYIVKFEIVILFLY